MEGIGRVEIWERKLSWTCKWKRLESEDGFKCRGQEGKGVSNIEVEWVLAFTERG